MRFEIQEIENGEVKEGEEEELTLKYRRFAHARRIAEELEMPEDCCSVTLQLRPCAR